MKSILKSSLTAFTVLALFVAVPSAAQLGKVLGGLQKAKDVKDKVDDIVITDAEEQQLGAQVSEQLRTKYGVVQDKAVHKYVALVGSALAQASSRPNLTWTFIVLDTDGVNAFAAPGGFVHITRGALALTQNEAELADVLGHEVSHITDKHTINTIRNSKAVKVTTDAIHSAVLSEVAQRSYEIVVENAYTRDQETEADKDGVILANKIGYAPTGLSAFLTRLEDRNKDLKDRSGLFASHPETKARVDALAKVISANKLDASAMVASRFHEAITYKPVPVSQVASVVGGSAGLTGGGDGKADPKASDPKSGDPKSGDSKSADPKPSGGKFGLGALNPTAKDKSSTQTVSSAGSRGVNPDRDATGGPNPALVTVTVSAADVAEFRKGIV